jgi:pimeloyl-ACP methyl ester carboxylesterase
MQRVTRMRRLEQRFRALLRGASLLAAVASIVIGLSGAAVAGPDRGPKVYLLRGFLNVFSLGLDELSAKIERRGIRSEVYNHTSWSRLAGEIAAEYKSGQTRPIILVGHSAGGSAVISLVEALGRAGVPVALAVVLDNSASTVSAGRANFLNLYASTGALSAGRGFHGRITNIDLAKQMPVGHLTIDKTEAVHNMVLRQITQVVPSRRPVARTNVAGAATASSTR